METTFKCKILADAIQLHFPDSVVLGSDAEQRQISIGDDEEHLLEVSQYKSKIDQIMITATDGDIFFEFTDCASGVYSFATIYDGGTVVLSNISTVATQMPTLSFPEYDATPVVVDILMCGD